MSILMSYAYRRPHEQLPPSHLMLDSGAFTQISRGDPVTVPELAAWYGHVPAERRAALDVIYDPVRSRANALAMRDDYGLDVIPVVHPGTAPAEVDRLADLGFSSVALGGTRFGYLDRGAAHRWITACLARAEARGMERHGFAYCPTEPRYMPTLMRFTSVDVSSWNQATKWGALVVWDGTRLRRLDCNTERLTVATLIRRWPIDVTATMTRTGGGDKRSWQWLTVSSCSYLAYGQWLMARGGPRVYLASAVDTLKVHLSKVAAVWDQLEEAA